MATQGPRGVVHQDYIVRQRYSNALPPPPGAPKLLDLPSSGLANYAMPPFASNMARAQPINIEADAFLGMPIDLVGMPGVFEGDESSIQAPLNTPAVHPRDRNLLRPLKTLGKAKNAVSEMSFLRRTQYTAEERNRIAPGDTRNPKNTGKRRKTEPSKEDPMTILRSTIKGFDVANPESAYKGPDTQDNIRGLPPTLAELEAWKTPKHPSQPHLKVLDTYPILPDLEAMPDSGGYTMIRMGGQPTDKIDGPDIRLETALLRALEPPPEVMAAVQAKMEAFKADPENNKDPGPPPMNYEFFLPTDETTARNLKRKFDPEDPSRDSSELYTNASQDADAPDSFRYNNIRTYETDSTTDLRQFPYAEVAVALYDPEPSSKEMNGTSGETLRLQQKAAYYYPIQLKTRLKPRRTVNLTQMGLAPRAVQEDPNKIDVVEVTVQDPDEEEAALRQKAAEELDTKDLADGTKDTVNGANEMADGA